MASKGELISRRDFLRMAGAGVGALLLGGCGTDGTGPTSTLIPTRLPTRTPVPTSTPDYDPTLEPLTPESHPIIPGLSIETYHVNTFQDITNRFTPNELSDMPQTFSTRGDNSRGGRNYSYIYDPEGLYVFGEIIKPPINKSPQGYSGVSIDYFDDKDKIAVYYSSILGKIYGGFGKPGRDLELLGLPDSYSVHLDLRSFNRSGKVLYGINNVCDARQGPNVAPTCKPAEKSAVILADIPNQTKTVIRPSDNLDRTYRLSDDGNALLISDRKNNIHVIDLQTWTLKVHIPEKLQEDERVFLNEDGTKVFLHAERLSTIINLRTSERETFYWPTNNSFGDAVASPNFQYFAVTVGMFASNKTEPGQWGVLVKTPHGFEWVKNPKMSFLTDQVLNDGTIIWNYYLSTYLAYSTPDENGKYTNITYTKNGVLTTVPIEKFVEFAG